MMEVTRRAQAAQQLEGELHQAGARLAGAEQACQHEAHMAETLAADLRASQERGAAEDELKAGTIRALGQVPMPTRLGRD